MEWLTNIINSCCVFCQIPTGKTPLLCSSCAKWATHLETSPPILQTIFSEQGSIEVLSLAPYEGWLKEIILAHKREAHPFVSKWFARRILEVWSCVLPTAELGWVPGSYLEPIHLVDSIVSELEQTGASLETNVRLCRKLWRPGKTQKKRSRNEREKIIAKPNFRIQKQKYDTISQRPLILFDDVATTGSTLLGCKKLIEPTRKVSLALTLAYTPAHKG